MIDLVSLSPSLEATPALSSDSSVPVEKDFSAQLLEILGSIEQVATPSLPLNTEMIPHEMPPPTPSNTDTAQEAQPLKVLDFVTSDPIANLQQFAVPVPPPDVRTDGRDVKPPTTDLTESKEEPLLVERILVKDDVVPKTSTTPPLPKVEAPEDLPGNPALESAQTGSVPLPESTPPAAAVENEPKPDVRGKEVPLARTPAKHEIVVRPHLPMSPEIVGTSDSPEEAPQNLAAAVAASNVESAPPRNSRKVPSPPDAKPEPPTTLSPIPQPQLPPSPASTITLTPVPIEVDSTAPIEPEPVSTDQRDRKTGATARALYFESPAVVVTTPQPSGPLHETEIPEIHAPEVLPSLLHKADAPTAQETPGHATVENLIPRAALDDVKKIEITTHHEVMKPADIQPLEPLNQALITTDPIANIRQMQLPPLAFVVQTLSLDAKPADHTKTDSSAREKSDIRMTAPATQPPDSARTLDTVEQPRPAQPIEIPDVPRLRVVRTVSMEVGEADSQVSIRIEDRGGGMKLHLGVGNETLQRALDSSVGSLMQALKREEIPLSTVEVSRKSPIEKVRRTKEASNGNR